MRRGMQIKMCACVGKVVARTACSLVDMEAENIIAEAFVPRGKTVNTRRNDDPILKGIKRYGSVDSGKLFSTVNAGNGRGAGSVCTI